MDDSDGLGKTACTILQLIRSRGWRTLPDSKVTIYENPRNAQPIYSIPESFFRCWKMLSEVSGSVRSLRCEAERPPCRCDRTGQRYVVGSLGNIIAAQ